MDLLSYAATLTLVMLAPGPVIAALVVRSLAGQVAATVAFTAGIILGALLALTAAATGVGLWIGQSESLRLAIKVAAASYLGWIALRLLRARPAEDVPARPLPFRGGAVEAAAGAAVTLSSPFILAFFLSVTAAMSERPGAALEQLPALILMTVVISASVLGGYIVMACRIQPLLREPGHRRRLDRGLGVLLAGATLWLALG